MCCSDYPYLAPVYEWLQTDGIAVAADLVAALVILLAGWLGIAIVKAVLRRALAPFKAKNPLAADFVASILVKTCWAFLVVIVLGKVGVDIAPLIAGLGVTGLVIGFAFRESLASLAAGLMIAINQPFKTGDWVIVAGNEGRVTRLDMMAVTIDTDDNRTITIPNRVAWGGPITVNHAK